MTKEDLDLAYSALKGAGEGAVTKVEDALYLDAYKDLLAPPSVYKSKWSNFYLATEYPYNSLWYVTFRGEMGEIAWFNEESLGIRPVVTLKSSVKFTSADPSHMTHDTNETAWNIS